MARRLNFVAAILADGALKGRRQFKQATDGMRGDAQRATLSIDKVRTALVSLGVGTGIVAIGRQVIDIASSFEQLEVQLRTVTGSAEAADAAFQEIQDFSARTPFQLRELTEGFAQLKARGFDPTQQSMTALGDLASAFGKDFNTALQAVTQAAFGEAEMLKQFGIIMRQETDQVRIRFQGMEEVVARDSQSIFDHLIRLSETNFGGQMAMQSQTFAGSLSTLKDNVTILANRVGDELLPALTSLNQRLTSIIQAFEDFKLDPISQMSIKLATAFLSASTGAGELKRLEKGLAEQGEPTAASLQAIGTVLDVLGFDVAAVQTKEWSEQLRRWVKVAEDARKKLENLVSAADRFDPTAPFLAQGGGEHALARIFDEADAKAEQLRQRLAEVGKEMDKLRLEQVRRKWDELRAVQEDVAAAFEATADAIARVSEALPQGLPDIGSIDLGDFDAGGLVDQLSAELRFMNAEAAADFEALYGETMRRLGEEYDRMIDNDRFRVELQHIQAELQFAITQAVSHGLSEGFRSGDSSAAMEQLALELTTIMFQAAGAAVGAAFGPFGAVAGAAIGGIVGSAIGGIFGGGDDEDNTLRFRAAIDAFGDATVVYFNASMSMLDAAITLGEIARSVRGELNDLSRILGGAVLLTGFAGPRVGPNRPPGDSGGSGKDDDDFFDFSRVDLADPLLGIIVPELDILVQRLGDEWLVAIGNLATGFGGSIEEAMREALDRFAQNLPGLIETGRVTLEGIPEALQAVLLNATFRTFEELKEGLEQAAEIFLGGLHPIQAELFAGMSELIVDIREGVRLGMRDSDLRAHIQNQIQQMISGIAGVDLFPQLINIGEAMTQFKEQLAALGLTARESAGFIGDARRAMRLFNQQLETNVLGQLADMAQEFGVQAEFVRKVRVAEAQIQFAIIKAQLISLGLWEKHRDIWKQLKDLALEAARSVGEVANQLGRIGSPGGIQVEVDGGGIEIPEPLKVEDVGAETTPGQQARDAVQGFIDRFVSPQDPITQLEAEYERLKKFIESLPGFHGQALQNLAAAFEDAMEKVLEDLRAPLRDFRDSLMIGQFSPLGVNEQVALAQADFESLLQRALGGDIDAFNQLQAAAQTLLGLGQEAFGGTTEEFLDLFNLVTEGLDEALLADLVPNDVLQLETQKEILAAQMDQTAVIAEGFAGLMGVETDWFSKIDKKLGDNNRLIGQSITGVAN